MAGFFSQDDRRSGFLLTPKRIADRISGFLNPGRNQRPGITNDVYQEGTNNQGSNNGAVVFPTASPDEAPQDNYGFVNPNNIYNNQNNYNNENNQNSNQQDVSNRPFQNGQNGSTDLQNNQEGFTPDTIGNSEVNNDQKNSVNPTQETASGGFIETGSTEGLKAETNDASYSGNTDITTLAPLTPSFDSRSNVNANFGPAGIFGNLNEFIA